MKKFLFGLLVCGFMISCGDDDADPILTITSGSSIDVLVTETEAGLATITGTATDDLGISNVTMSSASLAASIVIPAADLAATTGAFGVELTIDAGSEAGSFEIRVAATDTGSNVTEEIVTVNITN